MIIKKIILDNIRSYKHEEVEFPLGSTLLSGDIGSGKTSVLLGIEFALFGIQPGQRGNSLLRNGVDEGSVTLEFEVDEKDILIERTLKRGKTVTQDYCAITVDGEKREISVTELKNAVLELLNYPNEFSKKQNILYKFTVYTPQEEMKQIILQDPDTRINTLRHVFGIDKYKKILENASVILSKLREEKRRKEGSTENLEQDKMELITKEEELESKHYNLSSIEQELFIKTERRKKIREEQEEIIQKIEEKKNLEREVEKTNFLLINKRDTISNNNKTLEQLREQIKQLKSLVFDDSLIPSLETETTEKKKQKDVLNEKIITLNSEIVSLSIKNEENRKLEEKISELEICPTCLQNVDAVYRANVLNKNQSETSRNNLRLEELSRQKKEVTDKMKIINSEIFELEKKINDLKILKIKLQNIQEKQARTSEIELMNNMFNRDIEILTQHVESLRSSVNQLSVFERIFQQKQAELDEALKNERQAEIKVAEIKKEIDVFSKQIDELKDKIAKIREIKKQLEYIIHLEDWLTKSFIPLISNVERNVMIKLKKQFSELFSEWFSMLVSDSFNIRLDEEFTPVIEQSDYELDYTYMSGGERTAIALAYRLSLNQVINSFLSKIKTKDLVILDEPTDGFSEQQLDKMRDVLQQLNSAQLILVSHEQKIEGFVENVIKFKKENGVTRIEE
jgi:exonuclease SbcC